MSSEFHKKHLCMLIMRHMICLESFKLNVVWNLFQDWYIQVYLTLFLRFLSFCIHSSTRTVLVLVLLILQVGRKSFICFRNVRTVWIEDVRSFFKSYSLSREGFWTSQRILVIVFVIGQMSQSILCLATKLSTIGY